LLAGVGFPLLDIFQWLYFTAEGGEGEEQQGGGGGGGGDGSSAFFSPDSGVA
jgi:hypothetical protein